MSNDDKLKELLGKHFSGFEPELPENDWDEFSNKIYRKGRYNKLYHSLIISLLLVVLLVLNLPEIRLVNSGSNHKGEIISVSKPAPKTTDLKSTFKPSEKINSETGIKKAIHEKQYPLKLKTEVNKEQKVNNQQEKSSNTKQKEENKLKATDNNNIKTEKEAKNNVNSNHENNNNSKINKEPDNAIKVPDTNNVTNKETNNIQKNSVQNPVTVKKRNEKKSGIYLDITISPYYNFNNFKIDDQYAPEIHEDYVLIRKNSEKNGWGFSLGANLELFINEKLSVKSGLFYDESHTTGKYDFYNDKIPVVDTATGVILGYLTDKDTIGVHQKINNRFSYLEIPLIFNYRIFEKNKFSIGLKAGGDIIYCLSVKGTTITTQELMVTNLSSSSFRSFNWGTIAGINLRYRLNDRYILSLEPEWKQFWGSIYKKDEMITQKPSSLGLNISLMIKLK